MSRRRLLWLILLLLPSVSAAQDGGIPAMPEPSIPDYVSPLEVIDDMPAGEVSVVGDTVVFDRAAHARLKMVLTMPRRLSDDRARASWRAGWLSGVDAMLPSLHAERAEKANLLAKVAAVAQEEDDSTTAWVIVCLSTAGFAVGATLGYVIGDL